MSTTAGPVNTGMSFTQYTRIASLKTVTGSSQSFQSLPHSVTRTTNLNQTTRAWTAAIRTDLNKNNAGILQLCLVTTVTFQAPLPHIASWRLEIILAASWSHFNCINVLNIVLFSSGNCQIFFFSGVL